MLGDLNEEFEKEFSKLNANQKAAVLHENGKALCIAGPGSGKTRVITMRAMKLLSVSAESAAKNHKKVLLTMAFNTAAGAEMRERAETFSERFFDKNSEKMSKLADFSTIHAFCYKIVLRYAAKHNIKQPHVMGEEERVRLLCDIYTGLSGMQGVTEDTVKKISNYISSEGNAENEKNDPLIDRVKEKYELEKKAGNMIDFDDMLKKAITYLKNDEKFRRQISEEYIYYQVDEAQDLSPVQREIIEIVAGENVFYVADDDQSIYGFRGAAPQLLKKIAAAGGGAKRYTLSENYRSGDEMVNFASGFISGNRVRFSKRIHAFNSGGKIFVKTFATAVAEAKASAETILKDAQKGKTVCVLYRNNASGILQLIELYLVCKKSQTAAYPIVRGDTVRLSELIPIKRFAQKIKDGESPKEAYLRLEAGREMDLILFSEDVKGKRKFFAETVRDAIRVLAGNSRTREDFMEAVREVDCFAAGDCQNPGVCFSTVHSAKGLEFDTVVVVDCVRGEFPSTIDVNKSIEEERRLMYVAMTRAKSKLIITYPRRIGKMQLTASVFIDEIMSL